MSNIKKCALYSPDLHLAYTDFILSRQGKSSRQQTLDFYYYTVGKFLEWAEKNHNVTKPEELTARHVREYIVLLVDNGKKDTTVWNNARAIRTMFKFWYSEGYIQTDIRFEMPKKKKRRLPVLSAGELERVLKACNVRDRAIVMFLADSGLRRGEAIKLNWDDVDMQNGLVRVKEGKGGKDRSSVIGTRTRRALLAYRRTLPTEWRMGILFKTDEGTRFTGSGLFAVFVRLRKKLGIHFSPHAMRRTFTILSLRAGMDVLHLQGLGGWESLDLVYHYAQMEDQDLLQAHKKHSPVDNLDELK